MCVWEWLGGAGGETTVLVIGAPLVLSRTSALPRGFSAFLVGFCPFDALSFGPTAFLACCFLVAVARLLINA
jgi:hypothetical protein